MQRAIRLFAVIDLAVAITAAVLLTMGYLSAPTDAAWIGAALSEGLLALLLITYALAIVNAKQNAQRGWFWWLVLLVIVGVPGPYVVFLFFAGSAGPQIAEQYGLAYLVVDTLLPLLAAVGALAYSFRAEPYEARWDRAGDDLLSQAQGVNLDEYP